MLNLAFVTRVCLFAGALMSFPSAGLGQQAPEVAESETQADSETPALETGGERPEHTYRSVQDAPRPGKAGGMERPPHYPGGVRRGVGRVVLFPLRVVGEVVLFPLHWALYAFEAYNLGPLGKSIFFNQTDTFGLFPTALFETGFGLNAGARLIVRRIVSDVGVTARAGFGGRFQRVLSTRLSTNDSFKYLRFELEGIAEVRPQDRFYGIGNGNIVDDQPMGGLDPFSRRQRYSEFRQDAYRVFGLGVLQFHEDWSLSLSSAFSHRTFGDDGPDEVNTSERFDTTRISNFDTGNTSLYNEFEISCDTRETPSKWEAASTPSTGWLARVFMGYNFGLNSFSGESFRYGFDVQKYLRLYRGPRFLVFRAYGESIVGDYQDASFYDLPKLGGPLLLRGYDLDRFRDRFAALSSVEYQWDVNGFLSGFLFTDVGRVASSYGDFDFNNLRMGYGGGIEAHTRSSFAGRLTFASSLDGGLFINLSVDPVYDIRTRVERR